MNEKIYKSMSRGGVAAVVLGIIVGSVGLVCGILSIIFGSSLLKKRDQITF